ncbi:AAA domain-containing protein [Sphingobacterium bovistauri]|uniref:GreA/GreB family elongation factor n=1 Tax=Sphingobacterium bovistauri TaxID=2781959 RepID=A0ABS7Z7X3_9SPHI|nr:AAA domain-containing protein [Sphingobacterium bovistauri]MCA5004799.1 GreA/GreB family elongation factor [Sphingobacterium bovistauri]
MILSEKLLAELQRRLKIGNRRGVHLNAIPANSRYKFDLNRLSHIDKDLPNNFIKALLSEQPLKFRISWKENVPDLNSLFEEEQTQLVRITKAFENLINQTEVIESEKGINTFGFGFPILARRDKADNKLTVAPVLIWSLKIKRTKEFNTWEILRNEDDPIYINEVLINHLQSDSNVEIEQIPSEMLDDGLIKINELIDICTKLIKIVNTSSPDDLEEIFREKLDKIVSIGDKAHYEKLPLNSTNSFVEFGGLFSIFEVQKQNIINDYGNLMELQGIDISLDDLKEHTFQPISSVETDPSQQSILHSLEVTRNVLIQGPPGTGKSQTLTAVLINALENNKKTIVVCEKRTALEVLYNALIEKGLDYHCVLIRDIVKDRKTVVDSVRDRVDNSEYKSYTYKSSKDTLENIINKAKTLITNINGKHHKLDQKIIGSKSWTDVVGNLLAELRNNDDNNKLNIEKAGFSYSAHELNTLLDLVQKGQTFYTNFKPIESKSFFNPTKLVGDNPYIIEQNINDDFDFYTSELQQIKQLVETNRDEYKTLRKAELDKQITNIQNAIKQILAKENELSSLISTTKEKYCKFRQNEFCLQIENFNLIAKEIEKIFNENINNSDLINEKKINSFIYKLLATFSKNKKQTITDHSALQNSFSQLEKHLSNAKDIKSESFQGSLTNNNTTFKNVKSSLSEIKNSFDTKIETEFSGFNLNTILEVSNNHFQKIENEISNANTETHTLLQSIKTDFSNYLAEIEKLLQTLANELNKSKDIKLHYTFDKSFSDNKATLLIIQPKIEEIQNEFEAKTQNEFQKISLLKANASDIDIKSLPILQEKSNSLVSKFNSDNWLKAQLKTTDFYSFLTQLETFIEVKNEYFNSEQDLFLAEFKWFQFYNSLSENEKTIVKELKPKTNWRKPFLIFYLDSLLRVSASGGDLPVNDEEHKELDATLSGIEKEQLKYIKQFWYSKQIGATQLFIQNNYGLSVENLYNKRSSRNFKRLSLRQIVQKDADLFSTFFPIILTSPDVASNLFKGMNGYFDIVMFDEASQLRLEDNLPAILKGKQIIIAGDEHQMPPSNYFSKVFDGSVEDEDDIEEEEVIRVDKDDILLSCESLLDFGTELNFQKKHLDFHYRSRHPFLIDFSNYAFYNQRLKPLPNNFDYVPIKYIQVNGTFSEHTNTAEAEMVLSIIDKNINRLPNGEYPTIGIATFNIAQRNLIKSMILERQKFSKYADFNAKIQELEENGMFVKNLENIQGDERDVIILSTTYGKGKDGKFAQRFGPINHSKGYKLLNVIVTRAKYKVYCCSSIPETVFMNYKEHLTIEGSNNKRAVLYAYLAYCKAVSEADNDSRLSVLTTLAENTTNSAGINPRDFGELESPFEEEVYQSLVDYFGTEKLIPQLQFAGFRIDIVYDPKIIGVPKIAIECDGAKYHSSREAYLYDRHRQKILENHGFVFHRIWSTNWWRNSNRESKRLVDFIKQTESTVNEKIKDYSTTNFAFTDDIEILEQYVAENSLFDFETELEYIQAIEQAVPIKKLADNVVKLNSKVQVKYMNNGKDLNIHIVTTQNNKLTSNSIQKIYEKSPLAISLIGHSVGDIVKVGKLDNFVEIIKIVD